MQIENLSWFPGHMTKNQADDIRRDQEYGRRLRDRGRPHPPVLPQPGRGRADRGQAAAHRPQPRGSGRPGADPPVDAVLPRARAAVLEANAKNGVGTEKFSAAVRELLRDKLAAAAAKGQVGRWCALWCWAFPNVGKSTFINKVAHRKTARAEDRPGVTRSKQWVPVDAALELLDTPRHPLAEVR